MLSLLLLLTQTAPVPFAEGVISTSAFESHPQFTPDGKTLYFVKSTPQFSDWKIYVSHLQGGMWTKPAMAPFSGKYRDADPFITPDGNRFYFISDRPHSRKLRDDMDIWMMEKKGSGWGEPTRLGGDINSREDEWFPTVSRAGVLYFGSSRAGAIGGCDIWMVPVGTKIPKNLGPAINTAYDEIEPLIFPDGKRLIFNSNRPGGLGQLDFYASSLTAKGWAKPRPLRGGVNSNATELSPVLSRDGKSFLFTKYRGNSRLGDIMIVDLSRVLP